MKKIALIKLRVREFFLIWKNYGFSLAFWGLIWWVCFYIRWRYGRSLSLYALRKKTAYLDEYFQRYYGDILEKYRHAQECLPCDVYRIWVFWGQGEKEMPPLIRACYEQLCRFNDNVTLVTEENLGDYIQLPPCIYEKVLNGQFSRAHYSDIIRNTLLAEYGGIWLDATVWCVDTLPVEKLAQMPFYTVCGPISTGKKAVCYWTSLGWNWSTWCMGTSQKQHVLFSFLSEMLQQVAVREVCWPDYVLQDYLIHFTCREFPSVRRDMEEAQKHISPKPHLLADSMNKPYDQAVYDKLKEVGFAFKLSYRAKWKSMNSGGVQTFYGKLITCDKSAE